MFFPGYDRQIQPLSCVSRDGSKVKTIIYEGTQLGNSAWEPSLGTQLWNSAWELSLGTQFGNPAWEPSSGTQLGNPARELSLGTQLCLKTNILFKPSLDHFCGSTDFLNQNF